MSPELLALIEALDAVKESPGTKSEEGERLKAIYEARLDALLERTQISRVSLLSP